ncbi:MAG TPA: DUF2069 domain-containing protein [Rhodocyclaceae bacterium]|nr:DUF2069 domain-containing protein [Rhodocyclaceae bacterium]
MNDSSTKVGAGETAAATTATDNRKAVFFSRLSSVSLIALLFLCIAWELWLAPLRPGGSMLVLKSLPLCLPLLGILNGRRYTYQWTSLMILLYLAEGLVRATTEHGASQLLAAGEVLLASSLFIGCLGYARTSIAKP